MKRLKTIFLMWILIILIGSIISGLFGLPFLFKRPNESWWMYIEGINFILMLAYSSVFSIPGLIFLIIMMTSEEKDYNEFIRISRRYILVSIYFTFCGIFFIFWSVSGEIGSIILLLPIFIPYVLATYWVTYLMKRE